MTQYPFSQLQPSTTPDYPIAVIANPSADDLSAIAVIKTQVGAAYDRPYYPNGLVDMRPAGLDEIWACGWRQRLLKYDLQLNLKSVINTYNAPKPDNNYVFPWDMTIDFANGLVFFPCWSYNVVRVYDLAAFVDETYSRGANGTGGHLYDIGLPNGTANWFRADKGSATRNAEGGALHNVTACDIDGTGKLLIASYQGYGNASATTNTGFVVQYSYTSSGATFDRVIASNTGTYTDADTIVKPEFRHPYGKLRFKPGTRTFAVTSSNHSNGGFGYHEIDLDNLANGSLERRTLPTSNTVVDSWRPHSLSYDSSGNLLVTNRDGENAVIEETPNRELKGIAMLSASSTTPSSSYYRLNWPMVAIKLENVDGRDWLVAGDYSTHRISIMPFPDAIADGAAVVDITVDFRDVNGDSAPFPEGKTVLEQIPNGLVINTVDGSAQAPLASLGDTSKIVLIAK